MKLQFNEQGVPMLVFEEADAVITLTFREDPEKKNLKERLLEMLVAAYENEVLNRTMTDKEGE